MKPFLMLVLVCCLGAGLGCSDSESFSASDIREQLPQGAMQGTSWTMMEAVVRTSPFDDSELSVELFAEDVDDCDSFASSDMGTLLFSVAKMEGEYPLNLSLSGGGQTITFVPAPGQNVIATEGVVTVDALSDSEVTIGLVADAGSSSINGRFTATICQ